MKNRLVDQHAIDLARIQPCVVCSKIDNGAAHHVKSVATGGPDIEENLMPLCLFHHTHSVFGLHTIGINQLMKDQPQVVIWLRINGWEQNCHGGWFNQKVNDIIKKYSKMY